MTVGVLGRFSSNPSPDHMVAINHAFRYVDYTKHLCLAYSRENGGKAIHPAGYVDSDLAGDVTTAKSTRGYSFHLGNATFSWSSKLLPTVASSTAEAEYMSLFYGGQQAAWLRNFYEELSLPLDSPITIYCDSQPAIAILKNEGDHSRSKHFNIKYHAVRERVARKEIEVEYIETRSNIADILTKALSAPSTASTIEDLGLQPLDSVLKEESFYLDASTNPDSSFTQADLDALLGAE